MQTSTVKYLITIFFLLGGWSQPVYSQPTPAIHRADSLFHQRQYLKAFPLYEEIVTTAHVYSPSMLLKMAFIREGSRDYTGAMYYLHLYYAQTPNRAVLHKMEELAQTHRLTGYEYSDRQFFKMQLQKYHLLILEGMLIAAVVTVTILALRRKEKKTSNLFKGGFLLYLIFIFYYLNYLHFGREGLIQRNRVPVMSAPSAGATWLATVTPGHKLKLTGQQDIWYEVEWKNRRAYIRKRNILVLP